MIDMSTATQERIPQVTLGWRLKMALSFAHVTRQEMAEHLDIVTEVELRAAIAVLSA